MSKIPSQGAIFPSACMIVHISTTMTVCRSQSCRTRLGLPPRFFVVMTVISSEKLAALRKEMAKANVGVYIVQTQDEHNSEYVAECDQRRRWISGFTGSAGTAVISMEAAVLATDGRYFLQATEQLDGNWRLLKEGVPGDLTWRQWAVKEARETGKNIGVDPKLISFSTVLSIQELVTANDKFEIVGLETNLIDLVWHDKPSRPLNKVSVLPIKYSGQSSHDKVRKVRNYLSRNKSLAIVVTALDEVAWLFNLRGSDIEFNPVFFAYAMVTSTTATLYIDEQKVTDEVRAHLEPIVTIKSYESFWSELQAAAADVSMTNLAAGMSSSQHLSMTNITASADVSWAVYTALGNCSETINLVDYTPVEMYKGVKNSVELANARVAQVKDATALVRFFSWLDAAVNTPDFSMSDYQVAQKVLEFRQADPSFLGLSYDTIASSGPQAAVIHYAPSPDSKHLVTRSEVFLLDSGGQYLEGTTDITRTLHFGTPRKEEVEAYTLVLKGHIALAKAVWPEGYTGYILDTLARQFLWQYGMDYRHGTGHGIGSYLNVHEGPIGVGFRKYAPFEAGNLLSNEPGYYVDGKYGIRIESEVVVKEAKTKFNFDSKKYFDFETITFVPMCQRLIDRELLTKDEIDWINAYHEATFNALKDNLDPFEEAYAWLETETKAIPYN